ncbi:Ig domain protein group 2 domain protein [Desulfofarcimen acetoxidans DSM 771]|uniref:Ig domain protein group 2 domain protein n=1 Tax=Desulfofarcimen acetoxidans (strain ATCC 49208 / DSM 771 / KCTC 5769 / VKM B-1644 / 5575) TaxID=485916 RepID=C8VYD5_DESAS|nr:leucine-rich repeat protein [Desulfofarcimen acetoxidans]ACV62816.1 Ig domain protein group 2 domain protein [Desulfofarcimen acetoxidans DSM 771]
MKILKKSKIINILLVLLMLFTIVNPALAAGLTINPDQPAYSGGENAAVAASVYDDGTNAAGGTDGSSAAESEDNREIAEDNESAGVTEPQNNSDQTVSNLVYPANDTEKQAASPAIVLNEVSPDLGTVKVRVMDNVQRLAGDMPNISPAYREPFGEILPWTEVKITGGLTIRGALEKALAAKGITAYGAESYLSGIGPVISEDGSRTVDKLSEFSSGNKSGWMVTLNDWFINAGANTFMVKDGDIIEWCYTCDLGADLGADFNNNDTALKALSADKGIFTPVFAPQVKEYTLTLPAETQIKVAPTAANRYNQVTIQSNNATYRSTDEIAVVDNQVISVTCGKNIYRITVVISNNDQSNANAVIDLIGALPAVDDIDLSDREQIEAIRTAYENLTDTQKALVANYSVLIEAESKIAQIDGDNKTAADHVIALITALPAVNAITLADKEQVAAARTAYNSLREEQKALVDNLDALTAAEAKIASLENTGGSVVQNYPDDFLLSALNLEMEKGERKELVVLDTPRVGLDDQAFNRDDLIFSVNNLSVAGAVYDDVVAVEKENSDGSKKGTRYYVKGLNEGVAQIKVTYPGYRGQDTVVAVNVKKLSAAGPELTTDIALTKYDILYFIGDSLDYTFNVSTDSDASVAASVYGQEYAAQAGKITVRLKDGYNPIVVTAGNAGGTTTKVFNIRAKKMAIQMENLTRTGSADMYEGDIIQISYSGLVTPVPKVSRIYNPAAVGVSHSCKMPRYSIVSGSFSQYDLATSNGIRMELTGAGEFMLTDGHIDENWFGDGLYSEAPVGTAPPVTGAGQTDHRFSVLPDIRLTVKENAEYNPQLFTVNLENTEGIWPGDEVKINIPDLDIQTLAANHPKADEEWMTQEIINSYTAFNTNIPGLNTVKSESVKIIEDLEKLKTVKFIVPKDTRPGIYNLTGGYVWVKYGPAWWTKQKNYFITEIPDISIEVKEGVPGAEHGTIVISNTALKNKLAMAAGKGSGYTGNLTRNDLEAITGAVDLSHTDISDQDMSLLQYLKGVSSIDLSGNTGITAATVRESTFDWTVPKSLNFSGCGGVTAITTAAFYECANLTAITLPEGIASIGDRAFYSCKALTSITLPDTVTALGSNSFSRCTGLTGIVLSKSLQSIGEESFQGCTALAGIVLPDPVTTLKQQTFYDCRGLASITLPKNLQSIGEKCFMNCGALENITLPDSVTTLGDFSLAFCRGLTGIELPKGIQKMGVGCFAGTSLAILDLRGTTFTNVDNNWQCPGYTIVLLGQAAQLSPLAGVLLPGGSTLTITHDIPQDKAVVWSSSNTSVAIVAGGVVSGVNPGKAYIGARADDNTYSGYCQVTVADAENVKLDELSLSGITLKENFDPAKYTYTAKITGEITSTAVTVKAAVEGLVLTVNNKQVADGTPSEPVPLQVGNNSIEIKVTSADGMIVKTYTITITMAAISVVDDGIVFGNPLLREKMAVAAGKESGYTGKLTLAELAAITGTVDLSNAGITNDDMAVMKYLTGVSVINLSGNTAITSSAFKKDYFDWKTPKSLDFSGCTGITGMNSQAFRNCANLTGIAMPETLTSISSYAFENCIKLTVVSIPRSVGSIGSNAFYGCVSLTDISLPDSLTKMDANCLSQTGLKEIPVLPSGVTALPGRCFYGCSKLTYAKVSGYVTQIGASCFDVCPALAILDLRATSFSSVDANWKVPSSTICLLPGSDAGLLPETSTIKLGEETLTISHSIPPDKTVIWGSSDTGVAVVANGVVTGVEPGDAIICAKTDDNSYSGICHVSIVDTDNAKLQSLSLSGIVLNEAFNPSRNFYTAETGCHLKETAVTALAAEAVSGITVNDLPAAEGIPSEPVALSLGDNIIRVKVTTPDGTVTKTYTVSITVKTVYEGDGFVAIDNRELKNRLALAAGKESGYSGNLTFADLAGITGSIDLSNAGVTDEYMTVMKYLKGVSLIKLSGNSAITAATAQASSFDWTVPKSLDFSGCTGIKEIVQNAFKDCSNLTGIILPETVASLGNNSFYNCSGLTAMVIPEGVTSIGGGCFRGCGGLSSITLPAGIKSLGNGAFNSCIGLTSADLSAVDGNVLSSSLFQACTGITDLSNIKLPPGIEHLPDSFFYGCTGITVIKLPESINSLGNSAFSGTGVIEADLSAINTLGSSLLQNCPNLKTVKLAQGITGLPDNFLNGCTALSSIDLPDSLTSIGYNCFQNTKLTYIAVSANVTSLGNNCFNGVGTLAILNLRATNFTSVNSNWKVPAAAFVLLPGADAQLSPGSGKIEPGAALTISHGIPPEKTIAWCSSNPAVATVAGGVVTAVAKGSAVIAAKAGDDSYSGVCTVTVGEAVAGICDLNSDGSVNVQDMILAGQHFGESGTPGWSEFDINRDGIVDVLDMILVGQHFTV